MGANEDRSVALVRRAQASVEKARQTLVYPTAAALDASIPHFEDAAQAVATVKEALRSGALTSSSTLRMLLMQVRSELARAAALMQNAVGLRMGWAQVLYARGCGYTPRGEPAAPEPGRGVALEG